MRKFNGHGKSFSNGKFLLIAALLAGLYAPSLWWMVDRWWAADSYYSHGPLVPFVSGWLLWSRRKTLSKLPLVPSRWGWGWLAMGLLLQIASAFGRIYFTSAISFFFVAVGIVLLLGGRPLLAQVWFPVAFLLFMVPLPLSSIAALSLKMKLWAASVSSRILWAVGVPNLQQGSFLRLPHATVVVEDLCSGLRSLISLIALGFLCAYLMRSSWWKRGVLLLTAVPVAMGANVFRITVVSLVSELYGTQIASGTFHDVMGFITFLGAYGALTLLGWWLR